MICEQAVASAPSLLPPLQPDAIFAVRADVAQLVEQRFRKPQVTGSNPVVGSPTKCLSLPIPSRSSFLL